MHYTNRTTTIKLYQKQTSGSNRKWDLRSFVLFKVYTREMLLKLFRKIAYYLLYFLCTFSVPKKKKSEGITRWYFCTTIKRYLSLTAGWKNWFQCQNKWYLYNCLTFFCKICTWKMVILITSNFTIIFGK